MRKPLTGEPCAGEPLARFGGRGGRCPSLPLYTRPDSTGIAFVVKMTQRRDLKDISQTRVFEKPFAKHR